MRKIVKTVIAYLIILGLVYAMMWFVNSDSKTKDEVKKVFFHCGGLCEKRTS